MRQADVNKYKALLTAKHREIMSKSHRRDGICIVQSAEQIEAVQLAGQREIAALALERETESLMQVGAALKRIDDGQFGICVDCEEPISAKRLAAVPWAAYCLNCQELRDAREPIEAFGSKLAA
jgi:DnaK suppressor protein